MPTSNTDTQQELLYYGTPLDYKRTGEITVSLPYRSAISSGLTGGGRFRSGTFSAWRTLNSPFLTDLPGRLLPPDR